MDQLIGKRFNDLVILEKTDSYICISKKRNHKTMRTRYIVQCDCGVKFKAIKSFILNNKTRTCKECAYRLRPQSRQRVSTLDRLYYLTITRRIKKFKNKLFCNLSIDEFAEIIKNDCYYCGSKPTSKEYIRNNRFAKDTIIYANGIDRMNNNIGYIKENCVACCPDCNFMKGSLNIKDFFKHIELIMRKHVRN